MNPSFPLLVRFVGGKCALKCSHCFLPQDNGLEFMPSETLRLVVDQYEKASDQPTYIITGLEPLQIGLDFFRYFTELQADNSQNILQTSGVGLNAEWIKFLKCQDFSVGLSHDGPRNKELRGVGAIEQKYNMLKDAGVPTSILCTVTRETVGNPVSIADYFIEMGAEYVQFIAAKESSPGDDRVAPSGDDFADFLHASLVRSNINGGFVIDNYNAAGLAWDGTPTSCELEQTCGNYLTMNHLGEGSPCDFEDDWKLGNVHDTTITHMFRRSKGMADFRKLKTIPSEQCEGCQLRPACGRGCPRDRWLAGGYKEHSPMCAAHTETARRTM